MYSCSTSLCYTLRATFGCANQLSCRFVTAFSESLTRSARELAYEVRISGIPFTYSLPLEACSSYFSLSLFSYLLTCSLQLAAYSYLLPTITRSRPPRS